MLFTSVLLVIIALGAGVAIGWLAARVRTGAEAQALRSQLEGERARVAAQQAGEARLEQALKSLSHEAIDKNNTAFAQLVAPLKDNLSKVEQHVATVEKQRVEAYAGLREQVEMTHRASVQLRTETAQLVSALRAPSVRGRWGEQQLRRIVEAAGMVEQVDFAEQVHTPGVDGAVRPDMVVMLTGGKKVVVDAKAPFSAYLEANSARNDTERNERLATHAKHLRHHVDTLSSKAYWETLDGTPEFVVLFVPADVFLDAALQHDTALLEHAFASNVVIATPSTLIALLRTIAYTWRQEALAKNAEEIHKLGQELYTRLATFGGHMGKVGMSLTSAVERYNKAVGSLEGRVLVSARKFGELQGITKPLDETSQVETVPRTMESPELLDGLPAKPVKGAASQKKSAATRKKLD